MYESFSKIFRALSHPVRLKILELLKDEPKCGCDIWPVLGEEQSNISRHLAELKEAGIIDSKREGVRVLFSIKNPRILECIEIAKEIAKKEIEDKVKTARKFLKEE